MVVNGFIRSRLVQMALLIAIKLALLLEVLHRNTGLTMKRLLLQLLVFLLLGLLLPFMQLADGHSFRWMSKMSFLIVNFPRKSI